MSQWIKNKDKQADHHNHLKLHLSFDTPSAQGEVLANADQDVSGGGQADHLSGHRGDNNHDDDEDDLLAKLDEENLHEFVI